MQETDKSVGFLPFDSSHSGEEDEKTEVINGEWKMKDLDLAYWNIELLCHQLSQSFFKCFITWVSLL